MLDNQRRLRAGLVAVATLLASSTAFPQTFQAKAFQNEGGGLQRIGFRNLTPGTILDQVFSDLGEGPISVFGLNPMQGAGVNAAVVFDSSNPTGEDEDLGTPNEDFGGPGIGAAGEMGSPFVNAFPLGQLLIVSEDLTDADDDGLVDDPDDSDRVDSSITFDFLDLAPVRIGGMTLIDVEPDEPFAVVEFLDEGGALITSTNLPEPGDNGVVRFSFDQPGVHQMVVRLNGSGAIDNILYVSQGEGEDCNGNGIPDDEDIASGTSADCNGNGIPDECESDCDNDGIPDVCEDDCDGDGTPDDCEPDCDNDGIPDDCEDDCNGNGTPDDCEGCADSALVLWDLDNCFAFGHAAFFDEFIGTELDSCSNLELEPGIVEQKNGIHSCTNDAVTGEPGSAMCVPADPDLFFDVDDETHVVRVEIDVTESDGQTASLEQFSFWELAGLTYVVTDTMGYYFEAANNPPAFYGLRVLRDGNEVYYVEDVPTSTEWSEEVYDFTGDPAFEVTNETVRFTFELAAYAPIPNGALSSIWDLDEVSVRICCAGGGGAIADCDGDGIPDECETDSDGDGTPDDCEASPFVELKPAAKRR